MLRYFPTYFLRGDTSAAGPAAEAAGTHAWRSVAGAPFEVRAHAGSQFCAACAQAAAAVSKDPALAEAAAR